MPGDLDNARDSPQACARASSGGTMIRNKTTLALILLATASLFGVVGCTEESTKSFSSAPPAPTTPTPTKTAVTTQFEFRNDMRKLWTDHVTWTRVFIIDTIAGFSDTQQATERLLRNQDDIGEAIKPF